MWVFIINFCAAQNFQFPFYRVTYFAALVAAMDIRLMSRTGTARSFRHSAHNHAHFSDGILRSGFHLQSLLPASLVCRQSFALENICLLAALGSLIFTAEKE